MIRLLWRWTTLPRWAVGGFLAGTVAVWFERLAWATAADPDGAWRLTRALIATAVLFALLVLAMARRHQARKPRPTEPFPETDPVLPDWQNDCYRRPRKGRDVTFYDYRDPAWRTHFDRTETRP